MTKRPRYHVTPTSDGRWKVQKEGNQRASSTSDTKKESVDDGRQRAKAEDGQLLIHKQDGAIKEERTYGPDPYPPKG